MEGAYIMKIAERVDIQDIDEAGRKAHVLREAREHVPWVTLKVNYEHACIAEQQVYTYIET